MNIHKSLHHSNQVVSLDVFKWKYQVHITAFRANLLDFEQIFAVKH